MSDLSTATSAAAPTSRGGARPNAILTVVLVAYLLIVLDLSIVYTGLPEIAASMDLGPVGLAWVQNAYLLCFGGFLLLSARAGDLYGFKRMLMIGLGLFSAASLAIGLARTPDLLIGARAVQGIGASIIAPSVLSLISANFADGAPRSTALAMYAMVAGVGSSLGMVLGGVFAGLLSWRVGFLINAPIGIALLLAAGRVLDDARHGQGRLDLGGAATSTLGMVALVWGIVRTADHGWHGPAVLAALALAAMLLLAFVRLQARGRDPLLPLDIFASRVRVGAYLARMCFIGGSVGFFFFETQLLQQVMGFSPVQAGLGFLPMTIPTFLAALLVPGLTRRFGNARLACGAMAVMAVGLIWRCFAGATPVYWRDIALPMVLMGLGNGAGLGALTVAGVSGVSRDRQGAASGAVNAAHQLGGSLGLSLLVTVFAAAGGPLSHQVAVAVFAAGLLLALGLVIAVTMILPGGKTATAGLQSRRSQP